MKVKLTYTRVLMTTKEVSVAETQGQKGTREIRGWLEPFDPFFEVIDQIVSDRDKHRPRIFKSPRS